MKRKFTNVFLLVAIGIAALTSFVSCKDYEDDLRTESDIQNGLLWDETARLDERIDTLSDYLQQQIAILRGLQQNCSTNCNNRFERIETLIKTYCTLAHLNDTLNYYYTKTQIDNNFYNKTEANDTITYILNLINNLSEEGVLKENVDSALAAAEDAAEQVEEIAQKLRDDYATKKELADSVLKLNGKIDALDNAVKTAQKTADSAEAHAQKALDEVIRIEKIANAALDSAKTAQLRADEAYKLAETAKSVADLAKDLAEKLEPRVKALEDAKIALEEADRKLDERITKLNTRVEEVAGTARYAYKDAQYALQRVDSLNSALETAFQKLQEKDDSLAQAISEDFDSINRRCNILHDSIEAVYAYAEDLYNQAMDALQEVQDQLNYRIDSLAIDTRERIRATEITLGELKDRVEDAEDAIEGLQERMDNIEDLVGDVVEALVELEDALDKLTGRVNDLTNRLNKLITGIIIQGTYNPIYGYFATPWGIESNFLGTYYGSLTTGIDEFPTSTPNFYYYSSDWDRAKIYLSDADIEVYNDGNNEWQPDDQSGYLYFGREGNAGTVYLTVNSAKQQDFTGAEFQLVNSKDEEAPVKLSAIEKENNWTKTFGYTTRAAADNGLYRAKATITSNFAKAAPKINLSVDDVKDILKDIKANKSNPRNIDFANIASKAFKAATSNVLPAYGIKAPWNDSEGDHAVYSAYNLAATAVHPLSFSFLNDITPEYVPGIDRIENFVFNMVDRIKFSIPTFNIENLQAPTISKITLEEIDDAMLAKFSITMGIDTVIKIPAIEPQIEVTIDGQKATIPGFSIEVEIPEKIVYPTGYEDNDDYKIVIPKTTQTIYVSDKIADIPGTKIVPEVQPIQITTTDKEGKVWNGIHVNVMRTVNLEDAVKELYEKMSTPISNVNTMIDDMNTFLDKVNETLQELNKVNNLNQQVEDAKQDIKDQVAKYLDKFANKILPYLTPSRYLQPIMLGKTGDGFTRLSTSKAYPSKVSSTTVTLIPTTVNAEIVTPAYKKWVAVTNVYNIDRSVSAKKGDFQCKAARDAANKSSDLVNSVINGNNRRVNITLHKGYIYEISYQAMDFSGYVSAKKYYIMVK
ncbi:MAG: hypothetical protein IJT75_02840 [Bacteroidaceae bacterium]|nr:hypothetical protein [Bacteroidaceae bacterium]